MRNQKIKNSISLFLLLLLSCLVLLFSIYIKNLNREIFFLYLEAGLPQLNSLKPITLMFVGDIMLDRGVKYMIKQDGQGDWKFPFLKIADDLKRTELLSGNLEGPISDKGVKVGSIYSFRNEPEVIGGLIFAGFDILSVANNHIFDYGRGAMEDSFLRLKEARIDYVGGGFDEKEAYSPRIKEVRGVKIAFLSFTNLGTKYWSAKENRSGIAWLTAENLEGGIKKAKTEGDLVIVSIHFGEEYRLSPTPEQEFFAHLAIDSGADLVIGHHPHVIQPIEKYKGGYIAYSLGNFVFDQAFSEETMKGLMLKVLVENGLPRQNFEKNLIRGKIKEVIPIEIKINQYFQPEMVGKLKNEKGN